MSVKEKKQSSVGGIIDDIDSFYAHPDRQKQYPWYRYEDDYFGAVRLYCFAHREGTIFGVAIPENPSTSEYSKWFHRELKSRKILFFALQEDREKSGYVFQFQPQEKDQNNSVFFEHFLKKSKNLKIS